MSEKDDGRFVTEIELITDSKTRKRLRSRFEAARQVYNACLGEAIRRRERMIRSELYQQAREMPKGRERTKTFRAAAREAGFSEYDLNAYTKQFNRAWMAAHLDSHVNYQLAKRAFGAVKMWQYGVRGRPRFKRYGELRAVEGITNLQSIRWCEGLIVWSSSTRDKLELPAMIDEDNPVMMHGLAAELKYTRLVWREVRGKDRFYAQLVCVGKPYQRVQPGEGAVGLDLGPSTIAIVAESGRAELRQFVAELEERQREIRRLQRKMDRQRRANNPDNFNLNGTVKKGSKRWHKSNRQRRTERELAEAKRKQAAHRKSLQGWLVNRIVEMGDKIHMERLSYRSFQRNFGRSVGHRAPGMFVEMLRRRADALGLELTEFPSYSTRFNQLCHNCGSVTRKQLSDREHKCDGGITAQRDLYSAFLAMMYDPETETLDAELARDAWAGANAFEGVPFSDVLANATEVFGQRRPGRFGAAHGRKRRQ